MSACCAPGNGLPPDPSDLRSGRCPRCGAEGSRVSAITLKALLSSEGLKRGIPGAPRFCGTPGCEIVYFDNAHPAAFEQALVTVAVHAKHPDDGSVPVCYCFGYSPETIWNELASTARSSASTTIAAEVKAGHCACEVRNPRGVCCLGDVLRVERSAMTTR